MKFLSAIMIFLTCSLAFAQHDHGGSVTNAKAAEIASHRVGRLVDTGKVAESFLTNMNQVTVVSLPHQNAGEPAFQVNVKQAPNSAGKQSDLKLVLDMKGKFLSHKIEAEVSGSAAAEWPESPVSELVETALHYVTEQNPTGIDMKPFNQSMKSMTVVQKKASDGSIQAAMLIESSSTSKKLEVTLSSSGAILNVSVAQ